MKDKITIKNSVTTVALFNDFVVAKKSEGITDKTISSYEGHFKTISKYIDFNVPIETITKKEIQQLVIVLQNTTLAEQSIASYMRTLKTFFSWLNKEGYTNVNIKLYKAPETHKETYTDDELSKLLKKPANNYSFVEFRNWVIINLIMSCGARAKTIRFIQNRDVDFEAKTIFFRHTKNKKPQYIPIATPMQSILKKYMRTREGQDNDWLFCTETGQQLSEYGLCSAISRYNKNRGVNKTSTHLYRHSFAQRFIKDCGGNVFMLQELLGHENIEMSKHYFNEYGKDIINDYDKYSPLTMLTTSKKIKCK